MPKVFAFEVENNIRTVLAKILKPVMDNYSKVTENVGDLNECFGEVTRSIENVNRKLDKELQMNEKIDDLKQKHQRHLVLASVVDFWDFFIWKSSQRDCHVNLI